MSFQFRRRQDSASAQNQQDPYFDPNHVNQSYQDYQAQPSMGTPYPQQAYDPRYQHPVMPNAFNNQAGYEQHHQQPEPYFVQQQYENQHQAAYSGNFQQNDAARYTPSHSQPHFSQSPGVFETAAYMHPFQSNQIPRQNISSAVGIPGGYPNQAAGSNKSKSFSFWKDSNSSQQNGFEEPELESSSPVKLLVSVVGVAILAGLSWFAYKWVKSPGLDNPPLIHAEEGPHKVRPDHKGGVNIPYQDKLIYDRISDSEQPEERLLPPPEEPAYINQPMPEQIAPNGMMIQQQVQPQQMPAQQYQQPMQTPQQYAPNQPYPQQQYQQVNNGQMQPQNQVDYQQQQVPTVPVQQQPKVVNADSIDVEKEKPATTAKGTFFVQIATVKSEESALREWKRLKNKHGLQNQKSQIKEFETAEGDTVFRLLMGPFDDKVKALKHAVKIDGSKIVQMTE